MRKALLLTAAFAVTACQPDLTQKAELAEKAEHQPNGKAATGLCDFYQGPCPGSADGSLVMTPAHAPSERPLSLSLNLPDGEQVQSARIEGRDMFMGVIPVRFDDSGEAEVIYGSCASGYMVWRLWVTSEDKDGTEITRYFDWLADSTKPAS
ncbi:hypothetical protein [Ferrimonas marina]|uniref:Lipoprotein n=1 Tax=Ferrimonas marina TaxID=299255 RepID=A0A1M5NCS2_9GAMM|nr:hypothetical protein [Ferrimonas marina]SHG87287.1 hypothetical protein SAMN02745129_0995 [Ferrimonas marina]